MKKNVDLHLWNIALLKMLVSNIKEIDIPSGVEQWFSKLHARLLNGRKPNSTDMYYIHPQIQREDPRFHPILFSMNELLTYVLYVPRSHLTYVLTQQSGSRISRAIS